MKKINSSILAICVFSTLVWGCGENKTSNRIKNDKNTNTIISNEGIELQVISETSFRQEATRKSILTLNDSKFMNIVNALPQGEAAESIQMGSIKLKNQEESLLIGFPTGLIGEQNIFGGVITQVSDKSNETLGALKLTDLSPLHVRTVVSRLPNGSPAMTLVGCIDACDEFSNHKALINFPIVGLNKETNMLVVDMAAVGKELDLMSILDPQGKYTQLKAISSATTDVDFDMKTLIFDIKTKMIPIKDNPKDPSVKTTDFTVRWYIKLSSGFNPAFRARSSTAGVGFFETERFAETKITRFSTTGDGADAAPVKYYIKNVPSEFKKTFAKAMESWNDEFIKTIGKKLLSYEFIDAGDARGELYIPGDIRYNIIEWDLVNKAGYGGLGPSLANQHTGEIFSANVLIQGPSIVKIYSEWFGVSKKANTLIAQGKPSEANRLIKEFNVSVSRELSKRTKQIYKLRLGKHLEMNIHSQRKELEDPLAKGHFEIVPPNMTYEKYMDGYMMEILAHEMGHNLGLRHNFKGNLGAYENNSEPGSVSRSIMEYLGRPYRHLNIIGSYDRMAIAYGYKGTLPNHLDWFCTDEDQAYDQAQMSKKSPECSRSDATSDPFSYWEGRMNRIIDLVLETKSNTAPVWNVKELNSQIEEATKGLSAYAMSAENTADTWTNFFGKNNRPDDKSEIKGYVLERLKMKLCNPELIEIISAKESPEAKEITQSNFVELTNAVKANTAALGLYTEQDFKCAE